METPGRTLFIFVNRRRFGELEGVKPRNDRRRNRSASGTQTGRSHRPTGDGQGPRAIDVNATVTIKTGDHFLATRRIVEGG